MISFYSKTEFRLQNSKKVAQWISKTINIENFEEGDITYIFCDDVYLHKLNVEFLKHDTFTDIISFDNTIGKQLNGDVYISIERVRENAKTYEVIFENELHRVIIHGILHFCGYKDKTNKEALKMRDKEELALNDRKFI